MIIDLTGMDHVLMTKRFLIDSIKSIEIAEELCERPTSCLTIFLEYGAKEVGGLYEL